MKKPIEILLSGLLLMAVPNYGNGGEYPYSWTRLSPNGKFQAVALAGTSVATQIATYEQNHPDATQTEIDSFKAGVVSLESKFSRSGVFSTGNPASIVWSFLPGQAPGWVSNDGERLAVNAKSIGDFDYSEDAVVRILGPEGLKIDVCRSDLVSTLEWCAEQLVYSTNPEVESVTQSLSGTLQMTTTSGAMVELRLSDGEIVASNVLLTAAERLKTNTVALFCLLGIVLLIALLIAYASIMLVRRVRQA